jgi:hypothetical protein
MSNTARWTSYAHRGRSRRPARSQTSGTGVVDALGRAGFVARGVVYALIGWITLLIALDHQTLEADRTGAVELIASKPFGHVLLWFLVVGFAGMALWRLSVAIRPHDARRKKTSSRLSSLGKAVLYAAAAYTTARFAISGHSSGSTDQASTDFTADAMRHSGGRLLVGLVGVGFVIGGLALIKRGVQRTFVKDLQTGSMRPEERRWVPRLGMAGNIARGIVFGVAGGFLIDAAITFNPAQAKGVDSTIRSFAAAPFGPVLLILMAVGLAAFGVYSWCEARWRRL